VSINSTTNFDVLANDSDGGDGGTLSVVAVDATDSCGGSVAIANGGANIDYTAPGTAQTGCTFTYTVSDTQGTDVGTVTVDVTASQPVAMIGTWSIATSTSSISHTAPAGNNRVNVLLVSNESSGALITASSGCTGNMVRIGARADGNNSFSAFYEAIGSSGSSTNCTMNLTGTAAQQVIYVGTFENVLQAEGADDVAGPALAVYNSANNGSTGSTLLTVTMTGSPATPENGLAIVGGEHNTNSAFTNPTAGWTTWMTSGGSHQFIAAVRDSTSQSNSLTFEATAGGSSRWTAFMFALTPF